MDRYGQKQCSDRPWHLNDAQLVLFYELLHLNLMNKCNNPTLIVILLNTMNSDSLFM